MILQPNTCDCLSAGRPMRSELPPEDFHLYEDLILSGQIEQSAAPAVLRENPTFAAWYAARARQRQETRDAPAEHRGRSVR